MRIEVLYDTMTKKQKAFDIIKIKLKICQGQPQKPSRSVNLWGEYNYRKSRCVGQVQKRRGTTSSSRKRIEGRGRSADADIERLQTFGNKEKNYWHFKVQEASSLGTLLFVRPLLKRMNSQLVE